MNAEQYNALPEDLKLDVRLAITRGEELVINKGEPAIIIRNMQSIWPVIVNWKPRKDPAILWELVKYLVLKDIFPSTSSGTLFFTIPLHLPAVTIEESLIRAYCENNNDNWAKWCKDNGVTV